MYTGLNNQQVRLRRTRTSVCETLNREMDNRETDQPVLPARIESLMHVLYGLLTESLIADCGRDPEA